MTHRHQQQPRNNSLPTRAGQLHMTNKGTSSASHSLGTFPRGEGTRCEISTVFRNFVNIEGSRSTSRFSFGEAARRADEVPSLPCETALPTRERAIAYGQQRPPSPFPLRQGASADAVGHFPNKNWGRHKLQAFTRCSRQFAPPTCWGAATRWKVKSKLIRMTIGLTP